MLKSCKQCQMLSEEQLCPACGGPMSKQWSGYLVVHDVDNSELAHAMNIQRPGTYALKVR